MWVDGWEGVIPLTGTEERYKPFETRVPRPQKPQVRYYQPSGKSVHQCVIKLSTCVVHLFRRALRTHSLPRPPGLLGVVYAVIRCFRHFTASIPKWVNEHDELIRGRRATNTQGACAPNPLRSESNHQDDYDRYLSMRQLTTSAQCIAHQQQSSAF